MPSLMFSYRYEILAKLGSLLMEGGPDLDKDFEAGWLRKSTLLWFICGHLDFNIVALDVESSKCLPTKKSD